MRHGHRKNEYFFSPPSDSVFVTFGCAFSVCLATSMIGMNPMRPRESIRGLSILFSLSVLCFAAFSLHVSLCDQSTVSTGLLDVPQKEPCDPHVVYRGPAGLPPLKTRALLGEFLESRQLRDGCEVGVQRGIHAELLLRRWKSCRSFKLVDLWRQQDNYKDYANVDDEKQEAKYQDTQRRLAPWKDKTEYFRMLSVDAATQIPNQSLDFIYVDARHDYCGVMEDLEAYYPKLRPGGIMAGHDFLDNAEVTELSKRQGKPQDWSVCLDGTVNAGAVKGAVEDFAEKNGLVVSVMYQDGEYPSWMFQKPTRMECVPS